jgi:hypothetical protein
MAISTETDRRIEAAIAHLRQAGLEDEARAVEELLAAHRPAPRRLPPTPPAGDLVPIAEAARRLGLSRNAVQRRIDSGFLAGERDPENRYRFVSRASLERLLEFQRGVEVIAAPIGGIELEEAGRHSEVARMFDAALRELMALEEEELEQERAAEGR